MKMSSWGGKEALHISTSRMFTRILVPLDGSPRAERALAVAARLARAVAGTVVLLRAVGIPSAYASSLYGLSVGQIPLILEEALDAEQGEAEASLQRVSHAEKLAGVTVETHVVVGAATVAIEDIVSEEHIDLIVMCSHGNTGFKRWALGSVAQRVSRASQAPVLVLREDSDTPGSAYPDPLRPLRSIIALVALDGSQFAEAAIRPTATLVAALAAPAHGTLLLTRVVPLSALGTTSATKELALNEAKTYLHQATQQCADVAEKLNVSLNTAVAIGKEVADTLIRAAEQGDEIEGKRLTGSPIIGLPAWIALSSVVCVPLLSVFFRVEREDQVSSTWSSLFSCDPSPGDTTHILIHIDQKFHLVHGGADISDAWGREREYLWTNLLHRQPVLIGRLRPTGRMTISSISSGVSCFYYV